MSGPTFPIGAMINEMFVLAFLVVVESVRLLLGQQHEPVSFIKFWLWQYRLWSFQGRDTKLKRFFPMASCREWGTVTVIKFLKH